MSELRFDRRVVVVTGAGNGMGRAHALLLASRGAMVVVNDLGTASKVGDGASAVPAANVVQEIRDAGGKAVANADSVATEEGARAIVQTALNAFGRIDGIVHNAGIANTQRIGEITFDYYKKVIGVHLDGAFLLAREAWPHMVKQRYGRFVLISSLAGLEGVPGYANYAAAKTGMIGLSRVMGLEGAEHGIRANVLGVAAYTRMTAASFPILFGPQAEPLLEWWREYVRPELVSSVVAWLVHEECPVSGEIFNTNGGRTVRLFLAETLGYTNLDLSPEDVRDHFDQICDEQAYRVFKEGHASAAFNEEQLVAAGAKPRPQLHADPV